MKHYLMTINGQPTDSNEKLSIINPAKNEVFSTCALGDDTLVKRAVSSAKQAFPQWRDLSNTERATLIHSLGDLLETHSEELAQLITLETGKPLQGLNGVGAFMEIFGSVAWSHVTADIELPIDVIQDNEEARIEVHRKPLGVVASITPWNWPLMIAVWHIISALKVGNTVVLKPSENTPIATMRFVELANKVLPPGVLNIVTGKGNVGHTLVSHPDINKVVFTGSTETGKRIMQTAAGHLKRLVLELGGNDAAIVLPDVNPKKVAAEIFGAAFHNNGQTCACLKRLYVHSDIYDELCIEIADIAQQVVLGDGLEDETELGPLQNKSQLELIESLVKSAINEGGKILAGGMRLDKEGFFYQPTIISNLHNGSTLVDNEQFGPVLPIIKYDNLDEAIQLANDNTSGLGGSVWSSNIELASALALRLECGTSWVNGHGAIQPDAPFGGIKQSGIGVEFGRYGLEECTSIHTVKIHKSNNNLT